MIHCMQPALASAMMLLKVDVGVQAGNTVSSLTTNPYQGEDGNIAVSIKAGCKKLTQINAIVVQVIVVTQTKYPILECS